MKRLVLVSAFIAVPSIQKASAETIMYGYDALGRLASSGVSGGPASGATTGICYDAAGNRTSYSVTGRTAANATTVRAAGERAKITSVHSVSVKETASPM